MDEQLQVGEVVIYHDEKGVPHDAIKASYPNMLFFGPNNFAWPGFVPMDLQAAGPYVDAVIIPFIFYDGNNNFSGTATAQAELDTVSANLGDKPIIGSLYLSANPDSALTGSGAPFGGSINNTTQKGKGSDYAAITDFEATASTNGAVAGSQPFVGHRLWDWVDNLAEGVNWGLVSFADNAYDGYESINTSCVDAWGWKCGGEPATVRSSYSLGTGDGVTTSFSGAIVDLPILKKTVTIYSGVTTPAQLASDNFTRANANPIAGNWTTSFGNGIHDVQLLSNTARGSLTGESAAYNTGASWTNDQYATVTLGTLNSSLDFVGATVRDQTSANSRYICKARGPLSSSGAIQLSRYAAGNETILASGTFTLVAGDVIEIDVVGSALICKQNGTTRLAAADTLWTSGSAGIDLVTQGADIVANATATNWTGGSLTLQVSGTDDGNGNLSGAGISSGTIKYLSSGTFNVTFSSAPATGAGVTATYTQGGWGGLQTSFVPAITAESNKIFHTLEVNSFSLSSSTNLTRNKPTAASSTLATVGGGGNNYLSRRANDGDTATTWQPAASNPQWIRIDLLGKPSISKAILRWGSVYATAYTLDWSDDGLAWTTAFTQAAGAGGVETDTFTAVSHRYWRMNETTRSGGGSLVLQEFELYAQ